MATTIETRIPESDEVRSHRMGALKGKPFVRRIAVEGVLFLVLAVGGSLLFWGGSFGRNMVHDQLSAQKISFPVKGAAGFDAKTYPGLQRYAGQSVDSGPKAKAYAQQYIGAHLKDVYEGKTYSEVSTLQRANPTDAKLSAAKTTLFQGETLRGLLLYAWGWSVVATIAYWSAWGAFIGAAIVLLAMIWSVVRPHTA